VNRLAVIVVAIVSGDVACQESASSLRLHVDGAADPSIVDGPVATFDVSEAVVSADGNFSVVIADLAGDEGLQSTRYPSEFRFHARDAATRNFVFELVPGRVAIDDVPQPLVLTASPAR
jgi:hypothetical protein